MQAAGCGCLSRPANPRISRYAGFPENPVTQKARGLSVEAAMQRRADALAPGWREVVARSGLGRRLAVSLLPEEFAKQ